MSSFQWLLVHHFDQNPSSKELTQPTIIVIIVNHQTPNSNLPNIHPLSFSKSKTPNSTMLTPYPTPITPTQTRLGFIGIGVMGSAMATRLLAAGYSLTLYARTPSKSLHLQSLGARLADSPADVARTSDVVFTMLGHPSDVRQIVLENPNSILSSLNPGSVVVDHTSSHPALAKRIFDAARERECWAVDAPVSGGDIGDNLIWKF